jgi:hypothetical protein
MDETSSSETFIDIITYQTTRCHNSEDLILEKNGL